MANKISLQRITFAGFEHISDNFNIAAGIIVPAGRRTLATCGHSGMNGEGEVEATLLRQMEVTFENIEKSILAAHPSFTKEEAWQSVYQVTTYHKGGLTQVAIEIMFDVAKRAMGDHAPAWTAVGVDDLAFGSVEMSILASLP